MHSKFSLPHSNSLLSYPLNGAILKTSSHVALADFQYLGSTDWPWIPDSPASATWVLGLYSGATKTQFRWCYWGLNQDFMYAVHAF